MFAMPGGSPDHSFITGDMVALLHSQSPEGCRVFTSDLRIKIAPTGLYTYPDCGVICGEPELAGDPQDVLVSPVLIVHQDRRHVEHYSRQDDGSSTLRLSTLADAWCGS